MGPEGVLRDTGTARRFGLGVEEWVRLTRRSSTAGEPRLLGVGGRKQ